MPGDIIPSNLAKVLTAADRINHNPMLTFHLSSIDLRLRYPYLALFVPSLFFWYRKDSIFWWPKISSDIDEDLFPQSHSGVAVPCHDAY